MEFENAPLSLKAPADSCRYERLIAPLNGAALTGTPFDRLCSLFWERRVSPPRPPPSLPSYLVARSNTPRAWVKKKKRALAKTRCVRSGGRQKVRTPRGGEPRLRRPAWKPPPHARRPLCGW